MYIYTIVACGESILETLTDVCGEYFLQMTDLLRRAVDNEALDGTSGFQVCLILEEYTIIC